MLLPSKVAPHGYTKMIERFARECPKNQFIREYVKNGIQAIERHIKQSGDHHFKGIVNVDTDKFFYEINGKYKITFIDNGIGMTGDEMMTYCNDLSSSSDIETDHDNYGFGAKVAAAIKNKKGIIYRSWKDGVGHMVTFLYDPGSKQYGLQQCASDGEYKYYQPIEDSELIKPNIIEDHGTMVTLWGNDDDDDTYSPDHYDISTTRESWVLYYLNKRFFKIPENIQISARMGHDRDQKNTKYYYLAKVKGLSNALDAHTIKKGTVKLKDAEVEWRILDKDRKGHAREFVSGHSAVVFEDEVFSVEVGNAHKAIKAGVYMGSPNISYHVKPSGENYNQNSMRSNVFYRSEDTSLPWSAWAEEFENNFPSELKEYIEKCRQSIPGDDNTKSIKDKLKDYLPFFQLSKYRKSSIGRHLIDEEDLTTNNIGGSEPIKVNTKREKSGARNGIGNKPGVLEDLLSLAVKDTGSSAAKSNPDPFPSVQWVNEDDKSFAKEEMQDRAAIYREKENIVFANKNFIGFTDMQNSLIEEFPNIIAVNIVKVVENIFTQQFMETIAGTITLKNRKDWTPDQFDKAISAESLTVAVASRVYFMQEIKRKLGDKKYRQANFENHAEGS